MQFICFLSQPVFTVPAASLIQPWLSSTSICYKIDMGGCVLGPAVKVIYLSVTSCGEPGPRAGSFLMAGVKNPWPTANPHFYHVSIDWDGYPLVI